MVNSKRHRKIWNAKPLLVSLAVAVGFAAMSLSSPAAAADFTVYKSPYCGCCANWISQLQASGHTVATKDIENIEGIKNLAGVPEALRACHTATVEGYIVEGHVPLKEIERLLAERPQARGVAVPGMPGGSLGMEGGDPEPYNVVLFKADGTESVYARY